MGQYETSRGPSSQAAPSVHSLPEGAGIEKLNMAFNDTLVKLQVLSVVLDDNTLIPELKKHVQMSYVSMASVIATTGDK
jgi:hypothetical protein